MNNSFPKEVRLLAKKEFDYLRKDSTRLRSGFLVFIYKKNDLNNSRLGMAINRKFGNAVRRNYLKRLLRENFRQTKFETQTFDILVTVNQKLWQQRSPDKEEQNLQLKEDIKSGFSKLAIL